MPFDTWLKTLFQFFFASGKTQAHWRNKCSFHLRSNTTRAYWGLLHYTNMSLGEIFHFLWGENNWKKVTDFVFKKLNSWETSIAHNIRKTDRFLSPSSFCFVFFIKKIQNWNEFINNFEVYCTDECIPEQHRSLNMYYTASRPAWSR